MAEQFDYQDGRIWVQEKKFEAYKLLLPYGLSDVTDPVGSINQVREPSASSRRSTVVVDVIRGEPGLATFTINTRLFKTLNYLFKWRNRKVNVQGHLGQCGRPDSYISSQIAMAWGKAIRGDLSANMIAQLQGDDAPIEIQVPMSAEYGPVLVDFDVKFSSRIAIPDGEAIKGIAMLRDVCDDLSEQEDPGDIGYLVGAAGAGLYTTANVWYTTDAWETPVQLTNSPFAANEDISAVAVAGSKRDHRVIVLRGTTDGANPAEIAYIDVVSMGDDDWVNVDVGSVNGEYLLDIHLQDFTHVYVVSNTGRIYRSDNGGATWSLVKATGTQLNKIRGLFDGKVLAGGNTGTIWYSEDYGDSWTQLTAPSALTGNVTAVHITPDGTLFIGTSSGQVFGSYDEGDTWTTLSLQGATATGVVAIDSDGDDFIWVAANLGDSTGRVFRSTDGGASFRLWNLQLPTNSELNALFVVDLNYVFVGGEPHDGQGFLAKTLTNVLG